MLNKKKRERRRRRRRRRLVSTLYRVEGNPFCAILSSWALINSDEILVAIIKTLAQADWLEHEWFITHSGPSFCCPLFAAHTATEEAKRSLPFSVIILTCIHVYMQYGVAVAFILKLIPFLSLSICVCVCFRMRQDVCERGSWLAQRDLHIAIPGEYRGSRASVSIHLCRRAGGTRPSHFQRVQSSRHASRVSPSFLLFSFDLICVLHL